MSFLRRSWGALAALAVGFLVWFVGFDVLWALATVLGVGTVGVALIDLGAEEAPVWQPHMAETPRGARLEVAVIADSLTACDRLARPPALRRMLALLIAEHDDRLSRAVVVRRMQGVLITELQPRGLDPTDRSTDEAVMALLGRDAIAILRPDERNPVTTAGIERCLGAIERLRTESLS